MKDIKFGIIAKIAVVAVFTLLVVSVTAKAVPVLQVGVSDGSGGFVNYQANSNGPTEEETAITSGNEILVAGVYKKKMYFS